MNNQIGRYEIRGELGRGGFGQIFKAFDPKVGRMVAIKVLRAEGDQDLLARFRNEAAATGKLRHRNIVTIFDFGEHESTAYIVMELLEGEDLQRTMARRVNLTLLRKLDIAYQTADGLHHAHEHGIIHRDIKPANIMLLPDGMVKIMDFGIASFAQAVTARLTPQGNMIGTFNYMSPEQFQGRTADKRTDIFAFGVVVYELLAGRHPFGPAEPPAMMYNILYTPAPSLRELCPEAPARLEHILFRALEKDPELRYQSLEDIKFDVWPILLELKREHATGLLGEARQRAAAEQYETAQRLIREILEVDSSNSDAQQLREQVHEELQRRAVQPRIQQFLKSGQQELEARRFPSAIQNLESALRLDHSNAEVSALIGRARQMQQQAQRAERLLTDARQALEVSDLTAAQKSVVQARDADPQNPEVNALLERIRRDMGERERAHRLRDGLSRAKGKLLLEEFDGAHQILAELQQEQGESGEIAELLSRIAREQAARESRRLLDGELAAGKELITRGELAEAVERLRAARSRFPEASALAELLSYAEAELEAKQRRDGIQRILSEATRLIETDEHARAITVLQQGLSAYPGEPQLARALDAAAAAKTRFEREKAFNETNTEAAELLDSGAFQQALQRIDAFTAIHGQDPDLEQLRARIEAARQNRQREDQVREALARSGDLLKSGQAASAIQVLGAAIEQAPNDGRLHSALSLAQTKLREQQRAEEISRIVNQAEHFTATLLFDQAIEVLEQGLDAFPTDKALFQTRAAAMAARSSHEHREAMDKRIERISGLLADKKFDAAAKALEAAIRELGDDPALAALRDRIDKERNAHQRSEAVSSVQQLLDQRRPEEARALAEKHRLQFPDLAELDKLLATAQSAIALSELLDSVQRCLNRNALDDALRQVQENRKRFAGNPGWEALCQEVDRRKEFQQALKRVEEYRRQSDFQKAEELLRQIIHDYPRDSNLSLVLQRVTGERAAKERAQAITLARQEAERLLARGDAVAAIDRLDRACLDFPDDTGLVQTRIEAQRQADTRDAAVREKTEAHLRSIRQAIAAGDWKQASAAVSIALAEFPSDPAFGELAETVRRGQYQADLQSFAKQAQSRLHAKDFEGTAQLLADTRSFFGRETAWIRFEGDLRRRQSYETALQSAETLRHKGQYAEAETILRPITGQNAIDERAGLLLQTIVAEREARDRERTIQQALRDLEDLKAKGDLRGALTLVKRLNSQFPDDAGLLTAGVDIQNQLFEQEQAGRREKLTRSLEKVRGALASRQWEVALAAIDEAQKDYPDDAALPQLREQARQGQYREELERLVHETQQLLNRNDLEGAARLLDGSRARYGAEKLWEALETELTRRRAYNEALRKAEGYRNKEQYAKAAELLERIASQAPPDERASILLRTVKTEHEVQKQAKLSKTSAWAAIPRWIWPVAAIVLIGVVWWLASGKRQPVYRFDPSPAELHFPYQPGSVEPPDQDVVVGSQGAPFDVAPPSESWLTYTREGNRLHVHVKTAGLPATHATGRITITPKGEGAPAVLPVILVYLDALAEPPAKSRPQNERLQIEPARLDFPHYQIGDAIPVPQIVTIRHGDIATIDNPGSSWLRVEHRGVRIVASLIPDGLTPGVHSVDVKLHSGDGKEYSLPVTVPVTSAPVIPPPPPPQPPATPCMPLKDWHGRLHDDVTWYGDLPAGAEKILSLDGSPGRIIGGGSFPEVCAKVSKVEPSQVEVQQLPKTNQWRVKNNGGAVSSFKMFWTTVQ